MLAPIADKYTNEMTRLFYPQIVIGTMVTMAAPVIIGKLLGGKTGALIGAAFSVYALTRGR